MSTFFTGNRKNLICYWLKILQRVLAQFPCIYSHFCQPKFLRNFQTIKNINHKKVFSYTWNKRFLINYLNKSEIKIADQRRRRDFFGGGTPRPLKGYHAPPPQGSGGVGPPDGSVVSFFKTIQSIRKWIHFSKIATFFLPQKFIFSKTNLEKANIFNKSFWDFRSVILKI